MQPKDPQSVTGEAVNSSHTPCLPYSLHEPSLTPSPRRLYLAHLDRGTPDTAPRGSRRYQACAHRSGGPTSSDRSRDRKPCASPSPAFGSSREDPAGLSAAAPILFRSVACPRNLPPPAALRRGRVALGIQLRGEAFVRRRAIAAGGGEGLPRRESLGAPPWRWRCARRVTYLRCVARPLVRAGTRGGG